MADASTSGCPLDAILPGGGSSQMLDSLPAPCSAAGKVSSGVVDTMPERVDPPAGDPEPSPGENSTDEAGASTSAVLRSTLFTPPSGPLASIHEEEEDAQHARIRARSRISAETHAAGDRATCIYKPFTRDNAEKKRSASDANDLLDLEESLNDARSALEDLQSAASSAGPSSEREGSRAPRPCLLSRICQKLESLEQRIANVEIRLSESLELFHDHVEQQVTFRSHEEKAREQITDHFMTALESALQSQQKAIECEIAEFEANFLASTRSMDHGQASCTCTVADRADLQILRESSHACGTLKREALSQNLPVESTQEHERSGEDRDKKLQQAGAHVDPGKAHSDEQAQGHPHLRSRHADLQPANGDDYSLLESSLYEFDQPLPRERSTMEPQSQCTRAQYFV